MKRIYHCVIAVLITFVFLSPVYGKMNVSVSVEGIKGDIHKNVMALLSMEGQREHEDLNENLLKKLHQMAPDEIRRALQPFGYYKPDIKAELVKKETRWHARYIVTPGEPVVIETLEIQITGDGKSHTNIQKVVSQLPVQRNQVLNHLAYEDSVRLIQDTALNYGFLSAHMIKKKVEVLANESRAHILIHFETGPQYRFGEINFNQDALSKNFLIRYIPFIKGEPYSVSKMLDLQRALNNSDYFDAVEITPRIEQASDLEVPIDIRLVPRKRNKYKFGLGYGTDTGVRGSIGWENSRINKRGHKFSITLKASEIKSGITGEYTIPLKDPRTDSLVTSAGYIREETDTSDSEKIFVGTRFNHLRLGWKESIYLNYEEEDYDIADDAGRSELLIPGISWTKVWARNPVNPKRGLRIYLDLRGAHDAIVSDTSFFQLRTQIKFINSLWPGGRVILRGEGGTSVMSEFSELPPSVRFFAGGDHSVRGYGYNSLGPTNDSGEVIGSRHLIAGSVEFEQQIWGNWSAAVFYDAGNAIDHIEESLASGAGFGLRWKSPVGPVRFDLAYPLEKDDSNWRIHFIVGPDL